MADVGILRIVFLHKEKVRIGCVIILSVQCIVDVVKVLQNAIITKKWENKMDELYKVLVNFSFGEPITRKRLLLISGITPELIQKALETKCIIETTPSDIGEVRYLITIKGQKRL